MDLFLKMSLYVHDKLQNKNAFAYSDYFKISMAWLVSRVKIPRKESAVFGQTHWPGFAPADSLLFSDQIKHS